VGAPSCAIAAVAAAGLALHVLRNYQGPAKAWLAMGIALLAIGPWILWEVFAAPAFDLSVGERTIDYEFRDTAYAHDFAALNPQSDE